MSKKQKYNFNFKLRLVTTILRGKDSIGSLAKREGLSKSNLQFWLRLYQNYRLSKACKVVAKIIHQ
ncbi:transposase [Sphingobacterium sp. T2]|uniref:transposase n=1 Tax=Sphingobacterium sp. T2 TaxID=1590596 RepID=UPI00057BC295